MKFPRSSGILFHPSSLPSKYGIGDFGKEAYQFIDFLEESGQHIWQILPLGPTGFGDSPYQCLSAFAGNVMFVSLDDLVEDKYLDEDDTATAPGFTADRIAYGEVIEFKTKILSKAYANFRKTTDTGRQAAFLSFCQKNSWWLDDYALFRVLKEKHGGISWNNWNEDFAKREPQAIAKAESDFSDEIDEQKFYQYLFFKQWNKLKQYCNEKKIAIVGDLPIFVAYDSADVWRYPEYFKLDEDGTPLVVSGVPPDYFSATGQLWGNPLYNWDRLRKDKFDWWIQRMEASLETVDVIRIDHFRGFAASWEVPYGETTAQKGKWVPTPGNEFFSALQKHFGDTLPIIVEDLGVITPDVEELRDGFEFPGMRILQMAFGSDSCNIDLPHNYIQHSVVYTGTHDNDTTIGWFKSQAGTGSSRDAEQIEYERERCLRYLRSDGKNINWDFINSAFASVACIAIIPMQDVLGLGSTSRMNLPASQEGNWAWRMRSDALTSDVSQKLKDVTTLYGRDNPILSSQPVVSAATV
ncbi:MAG: 4-alpha-glucanotransferase [Candidatus Obscuribacterales bacterium]|nr:4-alpha-glucanotransferase [Candidatus Obscuribacterales bacterium]